MLQHSTWAWIHGYDASLTHILEDLKKHQEQTPDELPDARKRKLEQKFTRTGAEEIAAFWAVYAAADNGYRKGVIDRLADVKPPEVAPQKKQPAQQPEQNKQQTEPEAQPVHALIGAFIFFVPALLFVGIQYWRLPQESHWIALSVAHTDLSGTSITAGDLAYDRALVIVFSSIVCPASLKYDIGRTQIHNQYGPHGIRLISVNANFNEKNEAIQNHYTRHPLPFTIYRDPDNQLADLLGATQLQ